MCIHTYIYPYYDHHGLFHKFTYILHSLTWLKYKLIQKICNKAKRERAIIRIRKKLPTTKDRVNYVKILCFR